MTFFSRLTDIVTCNLADLLRGEAAPADALRQIIAEMEEGLAGARRSVAAASASADRLQSEIQEHRSRIAHWTEKARSELSGGREDQARVALIRKQELDDVVAGLEQQFEAAVATCEHLSTTLRALEARVHEARRKLHELDAGGAGQPLEAPGAEPPLDPAVLHDLDDARARQIDAELAELKRSLGQ
ncbi:MAG TPA: PspA/IM30 family protein [Planctomycetaceae bacterium]|nr:PspA/IM30 family protein [Planctomycetaceae bacterium]